MKTGYLHVVVICALAQVALAQQPTIKIWATPATDLVGVPGHPFDSGELNFMSYFLGCPSLIPPFPLSNDCGATTVYYVWGQFVNVPTNARIKALHVVASPLGGAEILSSIIYRHRYDVGGHVWDRWDNTAPIFMHGDPFAVGYAYTGAGNGIRNGSVANPYDLYCYLTRTFLIGAVEMRCPQPCGSSWLQLGLGPYGFQVFDAGGSDISGNIFVQLGDGALLGNPPTSGQAEWYPMTRCGGIFLDCNHNGIPDECDLSCGRPGCEGYLNCGHSVDCDGDGQPDECQPDLGPTIILEQPVGQTRCVGEAVDFSVVAQGSGSLRYQWFHNSYAIAGATQSMYTIPWVDPLDAGTYGVTVIGICDVAIGNTVGFTVITIPAVASPPGDQAIAAGDTATFSVTATGGFGYGYQWRRAAVPLSDGPYVSGSITDTLTITRADAADAGWYDVVITNECGYVVSPHAFLTVNPGPCPPRGSPFLTKTYLLDGDANGTPWSWRIESTDGKFTNLVELHVDGVAEGGALAVAERFAESINAYAAAHCRGEKQLFAAAQAAFGQTLLAIRTGSNADFRLWVGPADQEPTCLVVPEQLPACGFNPRIVCLSPNAGPPSAGTVSADRPVATAATADAPSLFVAPDEVPAPAIQPEPGVGAAEPAPSARTFRVVRHDCRTGAREVFANVHTTADLGPDPHGLALRGGGAPANEKAGDDPNWQLAPLQNPVQYPWSADCKIFYKLAGQSREASGSLISPRHVLTSGLVVCVGGSGDTWATDVRLYPGYDPNRAQGGPYGNARAVALWTFEDWLNDSASDYMIGVIEIDNPIGAVTGSFRYGVEYGIGYISYVVGGGYPAEDPFLDNYHYWWRGWMDFNSHHPHIHTRSYCGMTGSTLWWDLHDGKPVVVYYVHDSDDDQSPTQFTSVYELKDGIDDMVSAYIPAQADLMPVRLRPDTTEYRSGDTLTDAACYVFNYSSVPASYGLVPFQYHLYLSLDDTITTSDTLLATNTAIADFDHMEGRWLSFSPDPVIPYDTPIGNYYLGVIIDVNDWGPGNDVLDGAQAFPIHVYCGPIYPPAHVEATQGVFTSGIRITWDEVPSALWYDIYRSTSETPPATPFQSTSGIPVTWDNDPLPATEYHYWIDAIDSCGHHSPLSNFARGWTAPIAAPNVTASEGAYLNKVRIEWDPVPEPAHYYLVYRNTTSDPNGAVALYGWQIETYLDDEDSDPGVVHYYWVKASTTNDWNGIESGRSYSHRGWRGIAAPGGVTASDGEYADYVEVRWEAVPGADWFRVYRSAHSDPNTARPAPDSNWQSGLDWYDRDFYDAATVPGQNYYYFVQASTNSSGFPASELSAGVRGWRMLTPPRCIYASDGSYTDFVWVNWCAPAAGNYLYEVRRGTVNDPNWASPLGPPYWQAESYLSDETAEPNVVYYYWVEAYAVGSGDHLSGLSQSNAGRRAVDCNGNHIPDPYDHAPFKPVISQAPASQSRCIGAPTTFTVTATSYLTPAYQWRRDGEPLADSNSPAFTIPWTDPADIGTYDVVVTNGCGSTTSTSATLAVLMPIAIVEQPDSVPVAVQIGETVGFNVTATGETPLSYQWRHGTVPVSDNARISGATTAALTISNVQPDDAGAYDVIVTNVCGSVISLTGEFYIELPPFPGPGPLGLVSTYEVVGAGDGGSWSWRIDSATGSFASLSATDVPGVTGTGLEVAEALAASINASSGPAGSISAEARDVAGTVTLAIRSNAEAPLVLYVGPGSTADCRVELPLPACSFNPLIQQLPLPGRDCNRNGQDDLVDLLSGTSLDVNHDGIPDECAVGDVNCDGLVSFADINAFVAALEGQAFYEARYPGCRWMNADVNGDGVVSYADINPFVRRLTGQ